VPATNRRAARKVLMDAFFERYKWGGVRHLETAFIWFALERFVSEGGAPPSADDIE
jgi:hypothetical protein